VNTLKKITSKNVLAEFVLAMHVVFKIYLLVSNIGKVSFRGGQTIKCDLPVIIVVIVNSTALGGPWPPLEVS
jgi:hypothetical protein